MPFFTILLMEILAGAELDLFVPSFPELQSVFALTPFMVELTLGINLVAHCVGALIVGNLGDRYGRKPIILSGLVVFIIGSAFCVLAGEYWHLLLGRFLQGLGISGPAVLAYVVIADLYNRSEQQKLMGTLNGITTLAMAFAPVVGSYVNLFFNWQGNFTILLLIGIISLLMGIIFIPEGTANHNVQISLKEYLPIIKSKKAILYIASICLLVVGYWIFIGMAPILYMEDLGVDLKYFGFYQGAMAVIFGILSFSSSYFIRRYGQKTCFYASLSLIIFFIFAAIILIMLDINNPLIITGVMLWLAAGIILPINILYPLMLEAVDNAKGRLAALFKAVKLISMSISLQIVSYFYQGSFLYIAIPICFTLALAVIYCHQLVRQEDIFV